MARIDREKAVGSLRVASESTSELAGWVSFGGCRDSDKSASVGELWAHIWFPSILVVWRWPGIMVNRPESPRGAGIYRSDGVVLSRQ